MTTEEEVRLAQITSELASRRRGTAAAGPDSRHQRPSVKIKAIIGHDKAQYCICKQPADDAMIDCHDCKNWFHIRCVGFIMKRSRRDKYRCEPCTQKFNLRQKEEQAERELQEEEQARAEATKKAVKKAKVEEFDKRKKQKEIDPKPKRPMSAWFLYLNSVRANLMSQNPELDICGVTRLASGHWRDLAHEKRSVFEERARGLKEAYDVEMKEYNKRHKTPKKTAKQRKGRIDVLVDQYFAEINSKRKQPEQKEPQTTTKRTKLSPTDCNMPRKERTLTPAVIKELQSKETTLLLMLPDHSVMNFQVCLAPPKDENAHWPVEEMIESMSSACEQAEDAKSGFDMESMKHSVELFNATMMFVNPSNGDGSVPLIPTPPNAAQTSFIQNQVYRRVVTDASTLNRYSSFSDEVYGEAQHPLISELIATVPITKEMTFIDLGSGIGQVVMQMAAQAQCKMSHGIELSETPARYAKQLEVEFRSLMQQYGKSHGDFNLISGNFLDPEVLTPSMLNEADVLFVNNVAFGAETNQQLLERFSALKEGTKIVSMRSFATQVGGRGRLQSNGPISKEFRFRCSCGVTGVTASANRKDLVDCIQCGVWQHRRCTGVVTEEQSKSHLCDKCHRYMKKQVSMQDGMSMNVLGPFYSKAQNAVSWTSAPVSYFIHTIGKRCEPTKKVEEKQVEEQEEPQAAVSVQEVKEQIAPEEVAN